MAKATICNLCLHDSDRTVLDESSLASDRSCKVCYNEQLEALFDTCMAHHGSGDDHHAPRTETTGERILVPSNISLEILPDEVGVFAKMSLRIPQGELDVQLSRT